MAHFAQIKDDLVLDVIVVSNSDCNDLPFPESEPVGQAFIASLGLEGTWLQTSYSGSFRGCYAGLGYSFDVIANVFVPPPPAEI
jgi:hypothetical protein